MALVAADLGARAAAPVSVVAFARGQHGAAVVAAMAVSALALVRGLLVGWVTERESSYRWRRLLDAIEGHDALRLRTRPSDQTVAMLVGGVHHTANIAIGAIPRLWSDGLGLCAVGAGVLWLAGPSLLAAAIAGLVVLGASLGWAQRRQRRAATASYDEMSELVNDLEALVDGSAELRAHGRERGFARAALARATTMAGHQRRAATLGALLGLLPLGAALLAAIPVASFASLRRWLGLELTDLVSLSALAATGLVLALSAARSVEELVRSAPERALYARFLAAGSASRTEAGPPRHPRPPAGWLGVTDIELDALSLRYPRATSLTPAPISFRWQPGPGLALVGPNGAGKSTLALVLLGLLPPTSGRIVIGGEVADETLLGALRERVAYLPQRPLLLPSRTVGWHLRVLAGDEVSERELEAALGRLELAHVLRERAADRHPGSVLVSALSGGERQRMHLARCLLPHSGRPPELVILDEPEAGLDADGRTRLREIVTELATSSRVLLIAHDPSVVPESFARIECRRGPAALAGGA